jgi:hypothetical protein
VGRVGSLRIRPVAPDVDVCLLGDPAPSHGVEEVPKIAQREVREEDDGRWGTLRILADFERERRRRRGGILEGMAHEPSRANEAQKPAPTGADTAQEHGFADLQFYVPQDLLDVRFPPRSAATTALRWISTSNESIA